MTIVDEVIVERRGWGGLSDDPGLPIGMWIAAGAVVGDGSGGVRQLDVVFQPATATSLWSLMVSLEQLNVQDDNNVATPVSMRANNLDNDSGFNALWIFNVLAHATDGSAAMDLKSHQLPLFFPGASNAIAEVGLRFNIVNADTKRMIVIAQGYIWDAAARSAPGGPRRPGGSVYGKS